MRPFARDRRSSSAHGPTSCLHSSHAGALPWGWLQRTLGPLIGTLLVACSGGGAAADGAGGAQGAGGGAGGAGSGGADAGSGGTASASGGAAAGGAQSELTGGAGGVLAGAGGTDAGTGGSSTASWAEVRCFEHKETENQTCYGRLGDLWTTVRPACEFDETSRLPVHENADSCAEPDFATGWDETWCIASSDCYGRLGDWVTGLLATCARASSIDSERTPEEWYCPSDLADADASDADASDAAASDAAAPNRDVDPTTANPSDVDADPTNASSAWDDVHCYVFPGGLPAYSCFGRHGAYLSLYGVFPTCALEQTFASSMYYDPVDLSEVGCF